MYVLSQMSTSQIRPVCIRMFVSLLILTLLSQLGAQSGHSDYFIQQPEFIVKPLLSDHFAEFQCVATRAVAFITWNINGIAVTQSSTNVYFNNSVNETTQLRTYSLYLRTVEECNETEVVCVAKFMEDQTKNVTSTPATLLLQGSLETATNLTFAKSSRYGYMYWTISWSPPFSLDITDVDHDITYCVHLDYDTVNGTVHEIFSVCGIIEPQYTFSDLNLSSCVHYNITIVPVNGAGNGKSSSLSVDWSEAPENNTIRNAMVSAGNCSNLIQSEEIILDFTEMYATQLCGCEVAITSEDNIITTTVFESTTNEVTCDSSTLILRTNTTQLPLFMKYNAAITVYNSAGNQSLQKRISTHSLKSLSNFTAKPNTVIGSVIFERMLCSHSAIIHFAHVNHDGHYISSRSFFIFVTADKLNREVLINITNISGGTYILLGFSVLDDGSFYRPTITNFADKTTVHVPSTNNETSVTRVLQNSQVTVEVENTIIKLTCNHAAGCTMMAVPIFNFNNEIFLLHLKGTRYNQSAGQITPTKEGTYSVKVYPHNDNGVMSSDPAYDEELHLEIEYTAMTGLNTPVPPKPPKTKLVPLSVLAIIIIIIVLALAGIVYVYKLKVNKKDKKVNPLRNHPETTESNQLFNDLQKCEASRPASPSPSEYFIVTPYQKDVSQQTTLPDNGTQDTYV